MEFYNQYPRFFHTSQTSAIPHRLNGRHQAIIDPVDFKGKRVLDIASHDGRWSFAALQAGASHVTGIEPRAELIDNAHQTFEHYHIKPQSYEFKKGDVFEVLDGSIQVDVALCLGFFYHTIRHAELLDRIERTGAQIVVIDTEVTPAPLSTPVHSGNDPRIVFNNPHDIQIFLDPVDSQQMAYEDSLTRGGNTLVGRPSRSAVNLMSGHFGYSCKTYDWPAHFINHSDHAAAMVDYAEGWRDTFYLSR